jgi:hypothetical protein
MFALLALLAFVLALFRVDVGFDLVVLGLCLYMLQVVSGGWAPWTAWRRQPPP